jgi:GH18 family chitinase
MKNPLLLALITMFVTLIVSCATEQPTDTPEPTLTAVPTATAVPEPPFRVVAYTTASIVPELIPYDRLTHIIYAFLVPNADGTFAPLANTWKIKEIVTRGREANVQVLIAVGGWGWDEQFETMAANPEYRATFIQNLSQFVDEYGLDGVDIDWEYPDPGQSGQNFLALIRELRQAMPDITLTTAVVSYGGTGDGIVSESFELFDFVNVMTYDGPDHGTMTQFTAGLDYWGQRGLPPEKMVMGLPFYARPSETIYRNIVAENPQAAYTDTIELNGVPIFYNGIPTVQTKTRLAMEQAGGIMFWTLDQDTVDELSLLQAIDEVVNEP